MQELYSTIKDSFGAQAQVYLSKNDIHRVIYKDANGIKFFTEEYNNVPIEVIEQHALSWAKGERELT
jgi:hypothetical protein